MEINVNPDNEGKLPEILVINAGEQKIEYIAIEVLPAHVQEDIILYLEVQKALEDNGL